MIFIKAGSCWLMCLISSVLALDRPFRRPNTELTLFEIFAWRIIARERRLRDELRRVVGPELAHLRIGLEDGVGELSIHARHLADVDIEDGRPVFVKPHGSDRSVTQADVVHGLEESRSVVGVAPGDLERFLDDEKRRVRTGGVETGIMLIARVDAGDKCLVVRGIEAGGVPTGAESIDRLLAHQLENALVGARGIS